MDDDREIVHVHMTPMSSIDPCTADDNHNDPSKCPHNTL